MREVQQHEAGQTSGLGTVRESLLVRTVTSGPLASC